MPSIQERVVAAGRGVRAERDLAEAAADFYVLELLTAREDAGAARMLATFEGEPRERVRLLLGHGDRGRAPIRDAAPGQGGVARRARLLLP